MIVGLDKFAEFFKEHTEKYVIIGGTACDFHIGAAGFKPRATRDIDIILIVEALDLEFIKQFWQFIKTGNYKIKEESKGERNYYRFMEPEDVNFPWQIELFSRLPEAIKYEGEGHLTPIPAGADLSSLSAILMDNDYYNYTIEQSSSIDGLHQANTEALICLKAKAFIDMTERKAKGDQIDERNIRTHKSDIFRLALLLTPNNTFPLPKSIKNDMIQFVELIKEDLPGKRFFKDVGASGSNAIELLDLLKSNFELT